MASAGSAPEDTTIPGATPERWETAVEDFAQLVALGLDRAQDLADVIGELNRTRPGLMKAVAAGIGGAVLGSILAGRIPRRRPSAKQRAKRAAEALKRAAADRASALEQATAVAQAAAQRLAERAPSPSEIRERIPHIDRAAIQNGAATGQERARRMSPARMGKSGAANAAKLVPIAFALLRNPIVRNLLFRSASRMASRRRRSA